MLKVGIIDYGMSNLLSISRAFESFDTQVEILSYPDQIIKADRLVLPGVGAFPNGMDELKKRMFVEPILEFTKKGNPFLGVCLGMQMMLSKGFEKSEIEGLNLIEGEVLPLPLRSTEGIQNKVPHMGWNNINQPEGSDWELTIFNATKDGAIMYFVHSFYTKLKYEKNKLAQTQFGDLLFASAIRKNNCFGTQFHPEKSGEMGLTVLKSFLTL